MPLPTSLRVASALFLAISLGACGQPLVPFSLDTPPLILVPSSYAKVVDGRGRFREIYCAVRADHGRALPEDLPCDDALVRLLDEPAGNGRPVNLAGPGTSLRIVVVPGIFAECVREPLAFSDGLAHLRALGYATDYVPVSGRSGTDHNARQIRDHILRLPMAPQERVLLVAHSKGAADSLEALSSYPEIVPRVAALASVAGVIAGSPLADHYAWLYDHLLRDMDLEACQPGDGRGVDSIRRSTRLAALAHTRLPAQVKYFSIAGIPGREQMSRILRSSYRKLARVDPRNDGQVIFSDAIIPGGTLLGYARADHWALAMPFSRSPAIFPLGPTLINHNAFPREVLLEAIVRFVEESL
jgi:hypothetical protein